ncbi:hypothetical protein [Pedobacter sp. V48]|uniref:hypothetical protein n=1 Tax=Pedobacter sp. V48 TaxID=509635 RepID=UPI0003E54E88|nr:hypothetical protein [Pedobacter sp. V48]ETZ21635.1 hypothetical protein N824_27335 [Pedobacter sp. V48]
MKKVLILLVLTCSSIVGRGQVASVNSIMKEAEKSYHSGDYEATLIKLEQAQKNAGKITSGILYWRILAQKAILPGVKDPVFYTNMKKFEALEMLRENCSFYLKSYGKLPAFSEQCNKVYEVQRSLKGYPVAKVEFDEIMHLQNAVKSNQ